MKLLKSLMKKKDKKIFDDAFHKLLRITNKYECANTFKSLTS